MTEYKLSKEFRERLKHPPIYKDFEIAIITKLIKGASLMDFDELSIQCLMIDMAFTDGLSEKDLKQKIKKFQQAIPNFLDSLNNVFEGAEKYVSATYKLRNLLSERKKNLPLHGIETDTDEVLNFIKSLKNDFYSFADAERLLKVTRQTLAKYADAGTHGLKTIRSKKRIYLTKESIIHFFRTQWEKQHGDFFDQLS